MKGIEGNENYYRIYRNGDTAYEKLFGKSGKELQHNYETSDAWKNVYTIRHMTKDKVVKFTDLKDAMYRAFIWCRKKPRPRHYG